MPVVAAMLSATLTFVPCPARVMLPDHIRPESCELARSAADALSRSATFRAEVARIGGANGIVYISPRPYVEPSTRRVLDGALLHRVTAAGRHRILHVLVRPQSGDGTAVTMAHEFQHAVELLEANVVSDREVQAFFARIGAGTGGWVVETPGAIDVERHVRSELRAR